MNKRPISSPWSLNSTLIHNTSDLRELWHRGYAHVHYKSLTRMRDFVKVYLKSRLNMMEFAKDVLLGNVSKEDLLIVIID